MAARLRGRDKPGGRLRCRIAGGNPAAARLRSPASAARPQPGDDSTVAARTPKPDPRVDILEKTTPFKGYFQVDRSRLRHRQFDGGWTDEMAREIFERGHAAAVLLYDPARDAVVLNEQFRPSAYAAGVTPWLVEVVAGIIEAGETPADVVQREDRKSTRLNSSP